MKTLILGGKGMLGQAFERLFTKQGWNFAIWDREELDITDADAVAKKIEAYNPELIINTAAYNAVDQAEDEPAVAMAINGTAVEHIVAIAKEIGAILVHYSTDFVFDGTDEVGYDEDATPDPLSVYGESKLKGEQAVIDGMDDEESAWYVIRTSRLFGIPGASEESKKSFPALMIQIARDKGALSVIDAEIGSPTYVEDLADATIDLVKTGAESGVYHRTNDGSCTWYEYAKEALAAAGIDVPITKIGPDAFPRKAARPAFSVLRTTKLPPMRSWKEAIHEFLS